MDAALAVAVVLAFAFAATNGLHDASNAIATLVATRAARPRHALALAAIFNCGLVGAGGVAASRRAAAAATTDDPRWWRRENRVMPMTSIALAGKSRLRASEHPVVACYRGLDSADAIQLGALLAAALDEPLVLASAYHYEPVGLSARAVPVPDNGRRKAAAQASMIWARAFAGTDVEVREQIVPSAGVAGALVELARDVDACVLVLGRDTRGSVTRSLLTRATCPIAVAPLSLSLPQSGQIERIGVAYDDSPTAQLALVAAAALARVTGARLVALAAGSTTKHATTWLHGARQALGGEVEYVTRALVGDPSATLARASDELDLLVCGSRGRGRPLAAILGSVSARLVAEARCPVLVVPPVVRSSATDPLGITCGAASAS